MNRKKILVFLVVVTACGALGVLLDACIPLRLTNQVWATLTGSVCGLLAAIPTSLLIIAVSSHRQASQKYQDVISFNEDEYNLAIATVRDGQRWLCWRVPNDINDEGVEVIRQHLREQLSHLAEE